MKDKIKYYLLLLAFLFIMALILWFFHDWIEQYSNSLMVLITFIYVVATIEICRANIKSAEATKEQLEESKHQFAENERLQMMPYFEIIVHDDIRDFVECIELTMWHQIRGYVVKNEYAESLICALSGVDFMGRWMPEAQSNSAMYNKEYYWSDAHTFFNNPYYCGLEWVNIDSDHLNCVFPEKVLIPVKQYYSERKGELNSLNSEIASIYWHKPCEEMYTKLQLKYLKGSNSAFVDGAGELVCFESSELIGNDTGFYIRYDKLLEFLKSSSYTLVWTSLCEKRILTPSFGRWDLPPKAIHMSSVYYLKDGKIAKASETLFEDRLYY